MRTKLFLILATAAFVLAGWVGSSLAQEQNDYRFTGKVIDQSGKPIPGAEIVLHDPQAGTRIEFKTNDDGTFDRRIIPHGVYNATFSAPGYVTTSMHFDWSAVGPQVIEKVAQVVLESEVDKQRQELGKKEAQLYKDAYDALSAGDYVNARKDAEDLLSMGAGGYEYAVRFVLARCDAMQGNLDSAKVEYARVLELKPDLFEAHFDMGGILEREGKHDEALKEYMTAAQENATDAETQYQIGAILLQDEKQYDEAMPYLRKALELDPKHVLATKALGLADLWAKEKDIPEGVSLLNKYLELDPKAPDAAQIKEMIAAFQKQVPAPKPAGR
jgi:Tfp pilus assembly protein PilF